MRNRAAAIILSMLLVAPVFAEGLGAFQKFSMGAMLGVGPSYMMGSDKRYYDENSAFGLALYFRMAFPVSGGASVLADVGMDGAFGFKSEYEYQHYSVVDSVEIFAVEIAVMWNEFLSEHVFFSVGPSIRFPRMRDKVELDGNEIYSDEVEYGNDLWLDAVIALGYKFDGMEFGVRSGYEFLGMYKETDVYRELDINELRFRFYFTYWFGQRK